MVNNIERRHRETINSDGQLAYSDNAIRIPINSSTIPRTTTVLITPTLRILRPNSTTPKPKPKPERRADSSEDLALKIESYHKDAERRCLADYANDTNDEDYYCPCLPTEFRT